MAAPERRSTTHFTSFYTSLCAKQGICPINAVRAHKAQITDTILSIKVDRLQPEDWYPLLQALKVNKSLRNIRIFSSWFEVHRNGNDSELRQNWNGKRSRKSSTNPSSKPLIAPHLLHPPIIHHSTATYDLSKSLKALLYCNTTITSLDVSGIPFRVRDIRLLSQGIAVAPLSTLRISDACLNSKHCAALCDALHVSKTVTTVDISRNNLDTRGIRFILDVIKSQAAARGSAAWHTSLRGRTIDMTVFKGILDLNINYNSTLGDDAVQEIFDALVDNLWLLRLSLRGCGITSSSAHLLHTLVAKNSTLIHVDLAENGLSNVTLDLCEKHLAFNRGETRRPPWNEHQIAALKNWTALYEDLSLVEEMSYIRNRRENKSHKLPTQKSSGKTLSRRLRKESENISQIAKNQTIKQCTDDPSQDVRKIIEDELVGAVSKFSQSTNNHNENTTKQLDKSLFSELDTEHELSNRHQSQDENDKYDNEMKTNHHITLSSSTQAQQKREQNRRRMKDIEEETSSFDASTQAYHHNHEGSTKLTCSHAIGKVFDSSTVGQNLTNRFFVKDRSETNTDDPAPPLLRLHNLDEADRNIHSTLHDLEEGERNLRSRLDTSSTRLSDSLASVRQLLQQYRKPVAKTSLEDSFRRTSSVFREQFHGNDAHSRDGNFLKSQLQRDEHSSSEDMEERQPPLSLRDLLSNPETPARQTRSTRPEVTVNVQSPYSSSKNKLMEPASVTDKAQEEKNHSHRPSLLQIAKLKQQLLAASRQRIEPASHHTEDETVMDGGDDQLAAIENSIRQLHGLLDRMTSHRT